MVLSGMMLVVLTFIIITLGYYFGRIRINGIAFDLAGVLIISLLSGVFLSLVNESEVLENITFNTYMSMLSSLGTSLFISCIGIASGYIFITGKGCKRMKSMFLGAAMTISSFAAIKLIRAIDLNTDRSVMLGILCGSMTSTPGLSALIEIDGIDSSLSTSGYGCSYLFGVIGIVLFAQILLKRCSKGSGSFEKTDKDSSVRSKAGLYGLIQIAVSIILGTLIGEINIPFVNFSLGTSGGILCAGMAAGCIVSKADKEKEISVSIISVLRSLGLMFFFVGSGVPAGVSFFDSVKPVYVIYGIVIAAFAMASGLIMGMILNKENRLMTLCSICGGMTSTPAIGIVCSQCGCKDELSAYSMSYIGALVTMVIGIKLLI